MRERVPNRVARFPFGFALALAFLAAACGGGESGSPSPTAEAISSAPTQASPTATETPGQISPSPTVAGPELYPSGATSGIPEVDAVLPALLSGDPSQVYARLEFSEFECVREFGQYRKPICRPGEPEGALVSAVPSAGCPEANFHTEETIQRYLAVFAEKEILGLYAVYKGEAAPEPIQLPGVPYAVVLVVVGANGGQFLTAFVSEDGTIVAFASSCDLLYARPGSEGRTAVLPPLGPAN